ncbi:hypothetical protein [Pedobacter cryoconitis]|nr:hypothetical protein [Pedobacter cryoconitis]MBB5649098.1 hypothetical protein [Pedobacter cryoconitis]
MSLTKKKLTLTKKTLFLYQKQSDRRPTVAPADPTGTFAGTSMSGFVQV